MLIDAQGNEYLVFDTHTHTGARRPVSSLLYTDHDFDAPALVRNMDQGGVDRAVTFPRLNPQTDYREQNLRILQWARDYPGRVIPFVRIHAFHQDTAVAHIAEYSSLGARGLKIHPAMEGGAIPVNSPPLMFPIMEAARAHGLAVLIHSGGSRNCTPILIADLAAHFPEVPVIIGHSGGAEAYQEAIIAAKSTPNVLLDTAGIAAPGYVANLVRGVGPDRVVYGSDHPMGPFGWEIRKVLQYGGFSPKENAMILGENLARALGDELQPGTPTKVQLSEI
jgi:predicted TIM-barrel fold metal-dependent hydrolase